MGRQLETMLRACAAPSRWWVLGMMLHLGPPACTRSAELEFATSTALYTP